MGRTESVKAMVRNFYRLNQEGKTIKEIAIMYGVSVSTIYKHLQEIADLNHVSREELLQFIHKPHLIIEENKRKEKKEVVDGEELIKSFSTMMNEADAIISKLQEVVDAFSHNTEEK